MVMPFQGPGGQTQFGTIGDYMLGPSHVAA